MAITKGEVRAAAFHEAGCQLEDMLEGAKADGHRHEGAALAGKKLAELIGALSGHVNKDVEEGKLTLEIAKAVTHYVSRAVVVAEAYTQQMVNQRQTNHGTVAGLQRGIDVMKKLHEMEQRKGDLSLVTSDPRPVGAGSIKQQRLAAEAAGTLVVPSPEPVSPEATTEPPPPETAPAVDPEPAPPAPAPEPPPPAAKPNGARGRGARGRGAHA